MSKGLDPDQDQHSVGPDLGPNRLQRLSADDKVTANKERVNSNHSFRVKLSLNSIILHLDIEHFKRQM